MVSLMLHSPIPRHYVGIAMYMIELNHFILFKKTSTLSKQKKPNNQNTCHDLMTLKLQKSHSAYKITNFSTSLTRRAPRTDMGSNPKVIWLPNKLQCLIAINSNFTKRFFGMVPKSRKKLISLCLSWAFIAVNLQRKQLFQFNRYRTSMPTSALRILSLEAKTY